jgi:hypothetical protein
MIDFLIVVLVAMFFAVFYEPVWACIKAACMLMGFFICLVCVFAAVFITFVFNAFAGGSK